MKFIGFILLLIMQLLWVNVESSQAEKGIERFSDIYRTREEIPAAQEEITDSAGTVYKLADWELEEIFVAGQIKEVGKAVRYKGLGRFDAIPKQTEVTLWDEESGAFLSADLSLEESRLLEERWEDFSFKATLHEVGSDYYLLSGQRVPEEAVPQGLGFYDVILMEQAGLDPEDTKLQQFDWNGGAFTEEDGDVCRNILISGRKRVWDWEALYQGLAEQPEYSYFRIKSSYLPAEAETQGETLSMAQENPAPAEGGAGWSEEMKRILKLCLKITIGLFYLMIALLGLRLLFWLWKRWREERKNRES